MRWIALLLFLLTCTILVKVNQLEDALQEISALQVLIDRQQQALFDMKTSCAVSLKDTAWMRKQVEEIPLDDD